jgi:hypothetical protein
VTKDADNKSGERGIKIYVLEIIFVNIHRHVYYFWWVGDIGY